MHVVLLTGFISLKIINLGFNELLASSGPQQAVTPRHLASRVDQTFLAPLPKEIPRLQTEKLPKRASFLGVQSEDSNLPQSKPLQIGQKLRVWNAVLQPLLNYLQAFSKNSKFQIVKQKDLFATPKKRSTLIWLKSAFDLPSDEQLKWEEGASARELFDQEFAAR